MLNAGPDLHGSGAVDGLGYIEAEYGSLHESEPGRIHRNPRRRPGLARQSIDR